MKARSDIYPVYFLYGPEDYLIEEEIQKLLNQTLSQKERGFNFHVFNSEEHNSQEIIQTAQTLPMFSQYRFVLISEADHMDEEKVEALMEYIQKPSPSTCLVLYGQTIGPWRAYRKEIEKVGKVTEHPRLRGKALASWVRKRMQKKGKPLSEDAEEYLIEIVGDHLYDIDNALEKVFLSVGEKRRIELSDVEEITTDVKISTVFDLTDAIGHQNLEKALGILEKAMESGAISFKKEQDPSKMDPVPLLLSMMAKQYWSMLVIKEMSAHHREVGELVKELGTSPWNIKKLVDQGKNFSEASLQEGIQKCHQTDLAIKRSRGPKDLLMEKLVIDLCRPVNPPSPPFRKGG
ncbi:MAG: DNA polymerase III subunit delta [Deltaproteobacteria bacterium CG03_land_8_20_14_0_80_45_14]|nr:MAG: DNA polymerase III subunit delta [Deltaproteobacteria bacterium CG03_land_8_20_14_0_80_45_14]